MAYLSFPDFMEKKRYRFQSRLWEGDPMYLEGTSTGICEGLPVWEICQ